MIHMIQDTGLIWAGYPPTISPQTWSVKIPAWTHLPPVSKIRLWTDGPKCSILTLLCKHSIKRHMM